MFLGVKNVHPAPELNQNELQYLKPVLRRVFKKANLVKQPLVFMQDNRFPNAMVVGDALIITTGLINFASESELEAVLAHECGHIIHGDVILTTLNYATSKMSDVMLVVGMGLVS
jgi:heat shock protein HtpX